MIPGFAILALALAAGAAGPDEPINVLIVAGQSNVLNWHAKAEDLPDSMLDRGIPFYHASGAPPDRGFAQPVNASSHGTWTTLGPQIQDPFVRYERAFFGPEITLARRLATENERPVAVIKVGFFGTTLADDWNPEATEGNRLYATLRSEIVRALDGLAAAGRPFRIAGFFWMQGETDAASETHADAYEANLQAFITRVRRDLATPGLPFILGRIGPPPPKGYPFQARVRAAQDAVAAASPGTAIVGTDDLARDTDGIHLLASGVIALGERWADAWLRLPRSPAESSDGTSPAPAGR